MHFCMFLCSVTPFIWLLCFLLLFMCPFLSSNSSPTFFQSRAPRLIYSWSHFCRRAWQTQDGNRNDTADFRPFNISLSLSLSLSPSLSLSCWLAQSHSIWPFPLTASTASTVIIVNLIVTVTSHITSCAVGAYMVLDLRLCNQCQLQIYSSKP